MDNHAVKIMALDIPTACYVAIELHDKEILDRFWELTCPCGDIVHYPINGLPEIDTLMPCGKENHWAVKYKQGNQGE